MGQTIKRNKTMIKKTTGNTTYEFDSVKELAEFEKLIGQTKTIQKIKPKKELKLEEHYPKKQYKPRADKNKQRVDWTTRTTQIIQQATQTPQSVLHLMQQTKMPIGGNYKKIRHHLKKQEKKNKTIQITYKGKRMYLAKVGEENKTSPDLTNITFRNVPEQYQKITRDIIKNMIKTHSRLTYENEGYMIGIEDKQLWNDFIIELLQKSPQITKELKVPNNFKLTGEDKTKYIIYQ